MGDHRNRVQAGKTAKRRGDLAEKEFDIASRYYKANRRLDWQPIHAQFIALGTVKNGSGRGKVYGYYKERSAADRVLTLADLGGRAVWIEIKSFSAKNTKTLDKGLHQYDQMRDAVETGAAMAFYATRWRWGAGREVEWRLFAVQGLVREVGRIVFAREAGLFVPSPQGWPEYLPVILAVSGREME